MEPRVEYAQTADGVSIAFWTLGEGMPLVHMPHPLMSHVQLEWRIPEARNFYENLAQRRKLVRYDCRGTGLSDREVADYSLDGLVLDLEAVVGRLGLERFALLAPARSGAVAVTYAVGHLERVSHLLLWNAWVRSADVRLTPQMRAVQTLVAQDWELATETGASVILGWSAGEPARRAAAFVRESITPEAYQAFDAAFEKVDITALLPQVKSPTLVMHRRQYPLYPVDGAKVLASRIPKARFALLEGESMMPFQEDVDAVLAAIDEFLGEGEEAAAGAEAPEAGAFRTVLFTDVEGSTALTQRLGDARARVLLREHERIVREALKSHSGSEVKTIGDGFMTSFSSATRALECSIAMQRTFAQRNETADEPILVRVGLNAGEPIAEQAEPGREDLFGMAVIMAARIADQAAGGEILASDVVRGLVAGKKFLFSDRGEVALRGFEDPVRLYEVSWRQA